MPQQRSIYIKYGSRITSGVAEIFYDRVLADPALAPFFADVDIDALRDHMADILSVITGGPDLYKGRDLAVAHAPYPITREDFLAVVAHLKAAMQTVGIDRTDIDQVLAEVAKTEATIVNR